jgi:hypothetical protein
VWVSWFGLKTKVDRFSQFGRKTSGYKFPGLDLNNGSYGVVISATKSPRRFLGLRLKTMWAIDGRMKMAWDTH